MGAVLFHYGYRAGAMMPVDEKAYTYFQQHHEPPPYQQQFNSIVYSLENSVPFLRLWQDSAWTPDPRQAVGALVAYVADFVANASVELRS